MPEKSLQVEGEDGCLYIFDIRRRHWYKFCPVDNLPPDVRVIVDESKLEADLLNQEK